MSAEAAPLDGPAAEPAVPVIPDLASGANDAGAVVEPAPRSTRGELAWWWRWTRWATLGEVAGFTAPAVMAALLADTADWVFVPAMVAAGVVEGSVLGAAQARVLCRRVPAIERRRWVAATGLAAGVAWTVGLLPSLTAGRLPDWSRWLAIPLLVILGAVLLGSIGSAQWWAMRRPVPRSGSWVLSTAAAWLVGLGLFFAIATPLWQPGQPAWLLIAIGLLGGLVMAASVAAVTGWAFVRLTRRPA